MLEAMETALGFSGVDLPAKPAIPVVPWAPHSQPRCQVFVDRETQSPMISLMFKKRHNNVSTPAGVLNKIVVRSCTCACVVSRHMFQGFVLSCCPTVQI